MRIKIKKVYYCEYCNRHGLRPVYKHEKHCTKNPNRECRLCDTVSGFYKDLIDKYKEKYNSLPTTKEGYGFTGYESSDLENILKELQDDVDGCPACTLSIILLAKLDGVDYDYKKDLENWWQEKNADRGIY